jgi:DNA invertase Pin-like site-specific DNA recombinase
MNGQRIGYIRVSSVGQNDDRQLDGVDLDEVFKEKLSAKTVKRPELQAALKYVRKGDQLHVHSIDRLARNLSDLLSIVTDLTERGVSVHFYKEGLTFNGDDNPMSKLMLQMMGAVAEFERSLIRERQAEGIAAAIKKGKKFGQPPKLLPIQIQEVREMVNERFSKTVIANKFGVSRQTIYNVLAQCRS